MVQDEYRQLYKKINKNWQESVSLYKQLLYENTKKDSIVLEAGCGFCNLFKEIYAKAKKVIGVDINPKFLEQNKYVDEAIVSDLRNMKKIKSNSIDIVFSSWVFEHLKEPLKVFMEFQRILKKGGKVIFITPNRLNYVVILNRLIPVFIRNIIVRKISKDLVTDPMKAYYKINTLKEIDRLSKKAGLKLKKIILNGDPTYIAICNLFFRIGILIEKLLDIRSLNKFKVHIIGILQK